MTYEQLIFKLDHQERVVFKAECGYICIGGAGKNIDGNYRTSGVWSSEKECLENIGCDVGLSKEILEELLPTWWQYIRSLPPEHTPVPVGTMVEILPNAKEECEKFGLGWSEEKEKMVGKKCEIKSIGCHYGIYTEDKSNSWAFPRTAFVIATEDKEIKPEPQETVITAAMVGRKIKIIVE